MHRYPDCQIAAKSVKCAFVSTSSLTTEKLPSLAAISRAVFIVEFLMRKSTATPLFSCSHVLLSCCLAARWSRCSHASDHDFWSESLVAELRRRCDRFCAEGEARK